MRIEQKFHRQPGAATLGKSFGKLIRDGAILIKILGIGDRFARAADRFQHGWEGLLAVEQHIDLITAHRWARRYALRWSGKRLLRQRS